MRRRYTSGNPQTEVCATEISLPIEISESEATLERKIINPSKWQDPLGFVQGHEVTGGQRVLYCAGQISVDADGKTLHAGDYRGQLNRTIDNLGQVLTSAGFGFADLVRLNIYTTDMEGFFANRNVITERIVAAGAR